MHESALKLFQEMLTTVSPRQFAWGTWLLCAIVYFFSLKRVRPDLLRVIKLITSPKLIMAFFVMVAYTVGTVYILYQIGFWDYSLLFKTIIWFIFSGIIAVFRAIEQARDTQYFKAIIKDSLKLAILLEFIVSKYTFSYFFEFLLVPVLVILSVCSVIANKDKDFQNPSGELLKKTLLTINGLINGVIVVYAISSALSDLDGLGNIGSIRKLLLSPLLSITFIGYTYFFALWSGYEQLFLRLSLGLPKSASLELASK